MTKFIRNLGENAPSWANEARWYFENSDGESWVATANKDIILISGEDIDWMEIRLTHVQASEYAELLTTTEVPTRDVFKNPLMQWIFSTEEAIWIASIIEWSKIHSIELKRHPTSLESLKLSIGA